MYMEPRTHKNLLKFLADQRGEAGPPAESAKPRRDLSKIPPSEVTDEELQQRLADVRREKAETAKAAAAGPTEAQPGQGMMPAAQPAKPKDDIDALMRQWDEEDKAKAAAAGQPPKPPEPAKPEAEHYGRREPDMHRARMNLAQKIAAAATAIALALFLLMGGRHASVPVGVHDGYGHMSTKYLDRLDVGQTIMDCVGISLIGGVVTWLLGIKRRKQKPGE